MTWAEILAGASARDSMAQGLGRRIRALRRERDVSQRGLGSSVGVEGSTVAHWELGTRLPSPEALRKCAAVLGTTPGYLLTGNADAPEDPGSSVHQLGALFGGSSSSDNIQSWPPAMQEALEAWAKFAAAPSAENLEGMIAKLPLPADARIAAALRVIHSGRRGAIGWYLHATDAMLDAMEDAMRRVSGGAEDTRSTDHDAT